MLAATALTWISSYQLPAGKESSNHSEDGSEGKKRRGSGLTYADADDIVVDGDRDGCGGGGHCLHMCSAHVHTVIKASGDFFFYQGRAPALSTDARGAIRLNVIAQRPQRLRRLNGIAKCRNMCAMPCGPRAPQPTPRRRSYRTVPSRQLARQCAPATWPYARDWSACAP